ncbi:cytochrome c biogenesis CcdA family protein [Breznakiella homolactica]|uniref:Cytochrome c biogenesis protein CcdA n=1 Tax=Breznakiella homolactica TaxID=2798577 RepID=A0A7T8B967_9SPIR|nr:cytochrome c biogenesis protein CcdA [Breznakiella homolactica]QQO08031.1 cytochrome c biogenesis protein CcdA [Breznakiella homolactica]
MAPVFEFISAFAAGLLSFLSPCVLPLVPSYLAMLAGSSVSELRSRAGGDSAGGESGRNAALGRSIAFTLGFTAVFIIFGLVFSQARAMVSGHSRIWNTIAGAVIVILGFNILFDFLSFLNREHRFRGAGRPATMVSAFLFGAAFGAGWSPCVGPILASILFLAGTGSLLKAAALLLLYSLGLALPFILAGLFFGRMERILGAVKRHMKAVRVISGLLLISIGLYMILGDLRGLSGTLARAGYSLAAAAERQPLAFRIGFAVLYGAAAAAFCAGFIRKRRKNPGGPPARGGWLAAAMVVFILLAAGEAAGIVTTPRLLSSWLTFQGI